MAASMKSFFKISYLVDCVSFDREETGRTFESYTFAEVFQLAINAMSFFEQEDHPWHKAISGQMGNYRKKLAEKEKYLMTRWIEKARVVLG